MNNKTISKPTKPVKTLLMIAFEFPPSNGASVPRIESFYRYLKLWGWRVVVLTANARAYQRVDEHYRDDADDLVYRAFALDAQRHLSIKGKYIEATATPDRWGATWIPAAVMKGKSLIKKYQPDVIWSSSPVPSTHYIANKLSRTANIPWVADYRDPFHYMNGSAGAKLDKVHRAIDRNTLTNATHLTFATSQVRDLYVERYGDLISDKNTVIENGFDEANFERLANLEDKSTPFSVGKFSMYYSGVLYPNGRDPIPVFKALASLKSKGVISGDNFELVFQGAGDGQEFVSELNSLNITNLVRFIKPVPFIRALNNMTRANALLLIQDTRFNKQIPGKVYEYLRTQRPMLVKADSQGATYKLAASFDGVETGMSTEELAAGLVRLVGNKIVHGHFTVYQRNLSAYEREQKAKQLESVMLGLI